MLNTSHSNRKDNRTYIIKTDDGRQLRRNRWFLKSLKKKSLNQVNIPDNIEIKEGEKQVQSTPQLKEQKHNSPDT